MGLALGASLSVGSPKKMAMLAATAFSPKNIAGLKLWVSADYGVTQGNISFINQIVISGCDPSSSDGTYYRSVGGTERFISEGGNFIYFNEDTWYLNNGDANTFVNANLNEGSWESLDETYSFGTAINSTTSINAITEVLDQSDNANNLTYSHGMPTISTNVINAKPAFYFFGGRLEGLDISTGKTIYAVIKLGATSPSGYKNILELSGGGLYTSIANNEWGSYFSESIGSGEQLSTNTKYIIGSISDDGYTYKFRSNGLQIKTNTNGLGFYGRGKLYFGNDSSHAQPANCYVAEALIYDTAISDGDAQQLESYLANKYAIDI